jgi:hypothetical protein
VCECETLSLTPREELGLRGFENGVLKDYLDTKLMLGTNKIYFLLTEKNQDES